MIGAELLNAWARLDWHDPVKTLCRFRALENQPGMAGASMKVRRLRVGPLKEVREKRDAALFSHGLATATGHKVYCAQSEEGDYDFVTSWLVDGRRFFCPVQLKELAPEDIAPRTDLKGLLASLRKYQKTDTALAVLLNQPSELSTAEIVDLGIPFSQVWLFWCSSADHSRWTIEGDILKHPARYKFRYPKADSE